MKAINWVLYQPQYHAIMLLGMAAVWYDLRREIKKHLRRKQKREEAAQLELFHANNPFG